MNKKPARNHSSNLLNELIKSIPTRQKERTTKKMLLAAKIDEGIKAKGWTQKEFAQKLEKHQSEITKWLSGIHNFTTDTLWDIQDVLGIKLISIERDSVEVVKSMELNVAMRALSGEYKTPYHLLGRSNINYMVEPSLIAVSMYTMDGILIAQEGGNTKIKASSKTLDIHG